jgi:hypothetical protein
MEVPLLVVTAALVQVLIQFGRRLHQLAHLALMLAAVAEEQQALEAHSPLVLVERAVVAQVEPPQETRPAEQPIQAAVVVVLVTQQAV